MQVSQILLDANGEAQVNITGDFLRIENVPSGNILTIKTTGAAPLPEMTRQGGTPSTENEDESFIGSTGRSIKFENQFQRLEITGGAANEEITLQTGFGWILDTQAGGSGGQSIGNVPFTIPMGIPLNQYLTFLTGMVFEAGGGVNVPQPFQTLDEQSLAVREPIAGIDLTVAVDGGAGIGIVHDFQGAIVYVALNTEGDSVTFGVEQGLQAVRTETRRPVIYNMDGSVYNALGVVVASGWYYLPIMGGVALDAIGGVGNHGNAFVTGNLTNSILG